MENIFISTPMSVISQEKYKGFRTQVISLIAFLKDLLLQPDIHYAGDKIAFLDQFDDPIKSYKHDIEALERCTIFVLIYPEKSSTSALIELGYALKMGVPVIIITPTRKILPYMILELDKSNKKSMLIEYGEKDILDYMRQIRSELKNFLKKI